MARDALAVRPRTLFLNDAKASAAVEEVDNLFNVG